MANKGVSVSNNNSANPDTVKLTITDDLTWTNNGTHPVTIVFLQDRSPFSKKKFGPINPNGGTANSGSVQGDSGNYPYEIAGGTAGSSDPTVIINR